MVIGGTSTRERTLIGDIWGSITFSLVNQKEIRPETPSIGENGAVVFFK